jgi:hypothetical protein
MELTKNQQDVSVTQGLTYLDFTDAIGGMVVNRGTNGSLDKEIVLELIEKRHKTVIRTICNETEELTHEYKNCLNGHIRDLHVNYKTQLIILGINPQLLPPDFQPFTPPKEN